MKLITFICMAICLLVMPAFAAPLPSHANHKPGIKEHFSMVKAMIRLVAHPGKSNNESTDRYIDNSAFPGYTCYRIKANRYGEVEYSDVEW